MFNVMKKVAGSSAIFASAFVFADKAFAQQIGGGLNVTTKTLSQWIKDIFSWASIVAGLVFVVLFLVGGIQYLTAAGNDEASGKAKKLLVDAVVGLLIVLIAYAVGNWVIQLVGLGTVDNLTGGK